MKKYFILLVSVAALLFSCGKDAEKPTVKTASVVDITSTSAKVNAIVENDGGAEVTKRGVEYACASFSEPDHDCSMGVIYAGSGAGEFQCELADLSPEQTIYVRAFAINEVGTSYGKEISFVTLGEGNDGGNDGGNEGEEDEETIINGYEYVDLGLPSGLKWATYNVGASSPYEVGEYFSWGELKSKDRYGMDNCPTYGVPIEDISGNAEYDVAAFAWGSTWRMPTETEFMELKNNCTMEWVMIDNNTQGCFVTGPNGNQIFFVSGGFWADTEVTFWDSEAAYWTSTPDKHDYDPGYSTFFYIYNNNFANRGWMSRYVGMPVRPVSD